MAPKKGGFTAAEVKAGITVIAAGAVLLLFLAAIHGLRPAEATKTFHSDFVSTGGLNRGGEVRFGGLKVGRVTEIAPCPSDRTRIRVSWAVGADIPVNEGSVASISQVSITAEKHLGVSTGDPGSPLLPGGSSVPVKGSGGGVFDALDDISSDVHQMLSDEGVLGDIRKILGAQKAGGAGGETVVPLTTVLSKADRAIGEVTALIGDLRGTVEGSRKDLEAILKKLQDMEDAARGLMGRVDGIIAENREDLRGSVAGAREIVGKVEKVIEAHSAQIDKIDAALERILADAQGLSGDARGMVAEGRPVLEETLGDLRDLIRDLKKFSRIAAENPNALILGAPTEGRR